MLTEGRVDKDSDHCLYRFSNSWSERAPGKGETGLRLEVLRREMIESTFDRQWHNTSAEEVLRFLGSNTSGLSEEGE
jgi:hypothetical protein